MIDFLWTWRYLVIAFFVPIIWAIIDFESFKDKMKDLIYLAEERAKKGMLEGGLEKENWVVSKIEILFPKTFALLGEENVRAIIKWIIKRAKGLLEKESL